MSVFSIAVVAGLVSGLEVASPTAQALKAVVMEGYGGWSRWRLRTTAFACPHITDARPPTERRGVGLGRSDDVIGFRLSTFRFHHHHHDVGLTLGSAMGTPAKPNVQNLFCIACPQAALACDF
jgi:hypothetical protein